MSTILIVEDNDKNMKLMRDVLQHAGHATLEARTGEAGVQLAIDHPPDLILMDVQLPGMSGIAALQEIRAHPVLQAIPVIAVSASVMPDDHRSIVNSGFDAFLTKPIALKTLRATVDRFLKQKGPR
ncbi:response regulator [Variovorax paradoxus]|nr:response regulator [Variovorax paradoxus]MBT2302151.1 response regulator [Variovorax paradoxus]